MNAVYCVEYRAPSRCREWVQTGPFYASRKEAKQALLEFSDNYPLLARDSGARVKRFVTRVPKSVVCA